MRLADLVPQLQALAVTLTPHPDGSIRCRAAKGVLSSEVLAAMRQHKVALHGLIEAWGERAALAEYCGGIPRGVAETQAWAWMLTQVHGRQAPALAGPQDL
jgi:hypothetical protein